MPSALFEQDMAGQAALAWPLVLNLLASYANSIITMSFVGHIGKRELAGAVANAAGRMQHPASLPPVCGPPPP